MLDDWNNNTCEGQYLKYLYKNKIYKGKSKNANSTDAFSNPIMPVSFTHMLTKQYSSWTIMVVRKFQLILRTIKYI